MYQSTCLKILLMEALNISHIITSEARSTSPTNIYAKVKIQNASETFSQMH